jgi:hypothetical protein
MHLQLNSSVDYPEKKLMKVQHFLQASSLIIGKRRHRSDVTRTLGKHKAAVKTPKKATPAPAALAIIGTC